MRAKDGDIWMWTSGNGITVEYWLITAVPSTALCIFGDSCGEVDEITVNDHGYAHHWKKVG